MNNLLIFTVATGRYRVYTDLFCYCVEKAYPEYGRLVLSQDLNIEYPKYYGACVRYLCELPESFSYCYITDIDMLIFREETSILDFHLAEIKDTGLCYSNSPRSTEEQGINRLTGLHFVTQDWWKVTREVRNKYLNELKSGIIGHQAIDDELILMKVVKESGFPLTKPKDLVKRHHGFHLGTLRWEQKSTYQKRRSEVYARLTQERARQWLEISDTQECRSILKEIKKRDSQAHWEITELNKFANQRVK